LIFVIQESVFKGIAVSPAIQRLDSNNFFTASRRWVKVPKLRKPTTSVGKKMAKRKMTTVFRFVKILWLNFFTRYLYRIAEISKILNSLNYSKFNDLNVK